VIEVKRVFGGPTGLTSKAVREAMKRIVQAVDQVGGDRRRQIQRLWKKRFPILRNEAEAMQCEETFNKFVKYKVDLFIGSAELIPKEESMHGKLSVRVCRPTNCVKIPTDKICIATGSRAHRPNKIYKNISIEFVPNVIIDSTEMSQIVDLPRTVGIIGGGVIAVEYATVFAKLGVGVSLICPKKNFLPFLEEDIKEALRARMSKEHVLFLESEISGIKLTNDRKALISFQKMALHPQTLKVDLLMYSGGRDANSEGLKCEAVNVEIGKFGRIEVDSRCRTTNPDIFAIGDVSGGGLASIAAQQGRYVSDQLFLNRLVIKANSMLNKSTPMEDVLDDDFFGSQNENVFESNEFESTEYESVEAESKLALFGTSFGAKVPLTLWTVPEVAGVGLSEGEIPYESKGKYVIGYAYFKDLARGRFSGEDGGFLKIIASVDKIGQHVVKGVHVMGEASNELIQLGSVMVHSKATLEQIVNTPFAAVTLSALYHVASDDALSKSPLSLY